MNAVGFLATRVVAIALGVGLLASPGALAEEARKGDAVRDLYKLGGLGVVGREIAGELDCEPAEISLLNAVGGQEVAKLEQQMVGGCEVYLVREGERKRLYRSWDHPEISYESMGLVYYEHRNGFARVFATEHAPGFWVRIADLPKGRLRPWSKILVESRQTYLGYDGQALHERPSEESPVLIALRGREDHPSNVHQLIPTGAVSGSWGKFEVVEFGSDFSMVRSEDANPTGRRWVGWLRLVNAAGAPEFWFYTRGC